MAAHPLRACSANKVPIAVVAVALSLALSLSGCVVAPSATALVAAVCDGTWTVQTAGPVADASLNEISGVAASRAHSGVLWVHEDSGAPARFFALSNSGSVVGTFDATGAGAVDWEDIALGPGPLAGITYLYLGDIGDNAAARSSIAVYRVAEPDADVSSPVATPQTVPAERLTLVYPDGPHNAETLLTDSNGDLYVVTKQSGSANLYKAPAGLAASSTTTLSAVGSITLPAGQLLTAGDVSPMGDAVALRTYTRLFIWNRTAGSALGDVLTGSRCERDLASEPQGEAIGFQPDARGLVTMTEGVNQNMHVYGAP